jgi:hypothetical protein
MNGLLDILGALKKNTEVKMFITPQVRREIYDHPLEIKQFELGAVRIHELIRKKILELSSASISDQLLATKTQELMNLANHSLKTEGQWMQVVSDAEMSCLALANEMKKQNHDVLVAIDERTARMLSEKPENLEQTMSAHLHKRVRFEGNLNIIKDIKIVRSSELVYVAYKKGLIDLKDPESLEALIYATKYKGAAISWDEINQLKKL